MYQIDSNKLKFNFKKFLVIKNVQYNSILIEFGQYFICIKSTKYYYNSNPSPTIVYKHNSQQYC